MSYSHNASVAQIQTLYFGVKTHIPLSPCRNLHLNMSWYHFYISGNVLMEFPKVGTGGKLKSVDRETASHQQADF